MTDESPLVEAKISALDELFRRDPLEMSDKDFDQVIEEMRKKSALWAKAEAEGKTRAPRAKKADAPQTIPDKSVFD